MTKMTNRQLSILLALLLSMGLTTTTAGCGDDEPETPVVPTPTPTPEPEPEPTPDPDPDPTPGPADDVTRFVGGDISVLTKYEEQQATYLDRDGKAIASLLPYLKEQGWNTMRVRLFVDPSKSTDKNVCQDLDYVKALGKRIKDAGHKLMLDFHYSDTWADPGQQTVPASWQGTDLAATVYTYTRECLQAMVAAGATPDFIQTGNEITFGMLWDSGKLVAASSWRTYQDTNWATFASYLKSAVKACREVCPQARIIIHTEQVAKNAPLTIDYYNRISQQGIDYDVIGLSYYPYFHGALSSLDNGLKQLEASFPGKKIQLVETGYPSKWEVGGTTYDYTASYPYSHEGQRQFTADLIAVLKKHPQVDGLSWWYAEANAKGAKGSMANGWYNASLFDNETGRALPALYELQAFKNE